MDHLFQLLADYLERGNADFENQADVFLATGRLPVSTDVEALPWRPEDEYPFTTSDLGTYRYLHHALNLTASLMLVARKSDRPEAAVAARELLTQWMDHHLYQRSSDPGYAWYDHGTPMRVLTMLLVWDYFCRDGHDARFRARLERALDLHGHLLASEAFYAYCQPVRIQNHAWFQDVGLISIAALRNGDTTAKRWLDVGISRLNDQFDNLIIDEGDHAIWSENSVGYHFGLIPLIHFTRAIAALSDLDPWGDLTDRMEAWSVQVRYPDGTYPAVGDTLPPLESSRSSPPERLDTAAYDWSKAGYAQVRGIDRAAGAAFQLFVIASSVNLVHKQADNLSFSLWFDGVEWLCDPGLISYDPNDGPARYVRGQWAHSSIIVADVNHRIDPRLATISLSTSEDGTHHITGTNHAYPGWETSRSMDCPGDTLLLTTRDVARCIDESSRSEIYSVFHAGKDVSVTSDGSTVVFTHDRSRFELILEIDGTDHIDIVRGWNGSDRNSSVRSRGLTLWEPTSSVLARHTPGQVLTWQLAPRERDAHHP